jgi:hypothetical protein
VRVCVADAGCAGTADGRVERVEPDGTATTIWRPTGSERALSASFGPGADDYWLSTTPADGTVIHLLHVNGGQAAAPLSVNRDASWQSVGAPMEAPDHSFAALWLDLGSIPAVAIVPLDGSPARFHAGAFAGFVDGTLISRPLAVHSPSPWQDLPPAGVAFVPPSVDDLIAAELQMNPGERAVARASHDAVGGDTSPHQSTVQRDETVSGGLYLDCFGPASVTVNVGAQTAPNPCLSSGSFIIEVDAVSPITVTATGDTSWRVVVYARP